MITRVGVLDGLTPAVARWLVDLTPASGRALVKGGRLIRTAALENIRATFHRTGRNRTGKGMRGLKLRADQQAGVRTVRVWHGSGILAAHELGSTVGPAKRWKGHVLPQAGRRGFTLRRRPTLEPAYRAQAQAVLALLEAEYQAVLNAAPPPIRR